VFYRLLSWLPLSLLHALARPGYLLLYHVAAYRRAVVQQNLSHAFPEKSPTEIDALARQFYWQLVEVALEIIKTRRMSATDIVDRVRVVNPDLLREYSNNFQDSVIMLAIHQGNWEWMLHGVKLSMNIPIDPVYKPLHNKTVDALILQIRSQFGSRPIPMVSAARDILRRRREFRLFTLVADQAPIESERSYWTEFLNRPAAFYEGGEAIAKLTNYPVLFAQCRRLAQGRYEVEFREVARPPYDADDHGIIERYVRLAEAAIRSEPQSWLWSNRRWKRDPPTTDH
jgi:KDO2-lipid IV(A) lauroyltransferase